MDFENESSWFCASYAIWFGFGGIGAICCSTWLCWNVISQRTWRCTEGTITYAKPYDYQVSYSIANRKQTKNERAVTVNFSYEVSGQRYTGTQEMKDDKVSRWENGRWYREHHDMKMPVYYNPHAPSESVVLKDRLGFTWFLLLMVGAYGLFDAFRACRWAIYKFRTN